MPLVSETRAPVESATSTAIRQVLLLLVGLLTVKPIETNLVPPRSSTLQSVTVTFLAASLGAEVTPDGAELAVPPPAGVVELSLLPPLLEMIPTISSTNKPRNMKRFFL